MPRSRPYCDPETLARIAGLSLRARRMVEGSLSGLHRSPYHGFSVEFAEYREYSPGDDLRRLDWRVWGRTDRHYIKEYEEESNLRATIVMDASASMRYASGSCSKYDYGGTLAVSLATLLIQQQDAVGLVLFDSRERQQLSPSATQAQLAQITHYVEASEPERDTDLGSVLQQLAERIRRRSLVIVISDLLTELDSFYEGLARMQYCGHDALVFHVLDRDELELPFGDLVLFHDIEGTEEVFAEPWAFRKAYRAAMQEFVGGVRDACGRKGIDYVPLVTDQNLGDALSHYLHSRARSQHVRAEGVKHQHAR